MKGGKKGQERIADLAEEGAQNHVEFVKALVFLL